MPTNVVPVDGGGWSAWLLESPGYLVITLVAISAIMRLVGKRNRRLGPIYVSWVALALGLGIYTLAWAVDTDREQITAATKALVSATDPIDQAALKTVLAPRAVLVGPSGNFWDDLTPAFVAEEIRTHQVTASAVRRLQAWTEGDSLGRSALEISSNVMGVPAQRTTWDLRWVQSPDGQWQIDQLRWLTWNAQPAEQGLYR